MQKKIFLVVISWKNTLQKSFFLYTEFPSDSN
jgi:hypothetical protein